MNKAEMSKLLGCKFCGSVLQLDGNPCENCGASLAIVGRADNDQVTATAVAKAITPVLKDSRRSRIYLTATALVFALMSGIFWEQSRSVSAPSEATLAEPLRTGPGDGWRTRQIVLNALADLSTLKLRVSEYFDLEGEFPESLADLKIDKERMLSRNIRSVSIEADGAILAGLTRRAGENIKLKWIPEVGMDGTRIQWICTANVPDHVLSYTTCEVF